LLTYVYNLFTARPLPASELPGKPVGKQLFDNLSEQAVIRQIRARRDQGWKLGQIAAYCTTAAPTVWLGQSHRERAVAADIGGWWYGHFVVLKSEEELCTQSISCMTWRS
jgi:hypothetical protein